MHNLLCLCVLGIVTVKRKVEKESDYGTKDIYSYGGRIARHRRRSLARLLTFSGIRSR